MPDAIGIGDLAARLETLRQAYPDPFRFHEELPDFLDQPVARGILGRGMPAARALLELLDTEVDPGLARVAVILLSRFPLADVYRPLLERLGRADMAMAEAFEPGLWLLDASEFQVADDVVRLVGSTGNPSPLLVLQRGAARHARAGLRRFLERRELPLTRLALYAYLNALAPDDVDLLRPLAAWKAVPDVAALAGLSLFSLGSNAGADGVVAGLTAPDEALRRAVYQELSRFVPEGGPGAGYAPEAPSRTAAAALVASARPQSSSDPSGLASLPATLAALVDEA